MRFLDQVIRRVPDHGIRNNLVPRVMVGKPSVELPQERVVELTMITNSTLRE
jgi:hypothetical protein